MKLSPIFLSLAVILMGNTIHANAATLRASADTADMCYGIDTKACEQVERECDINYTKGCQEYYDRLEELANEEGIDDEPAQ